MAAYIKAGTYVPAFCLGSAIARARTAQVYPVPVKTPVKYRENTVCLSDKALYLRYLE